MAGVLAMERVGVRRAGMVLFVEIHVQAAGTMSLDEAHRLGGKVKSAIREEVKEVGGVTVHMEPYGE